MLKQYSSKVLPFIFYAVPESDQESAKKPLAKFNSLNVEMDGKFEACIVALDAIFMAFKGSTVCKHNSKRGHNP